MDWSDLSRHAIAAILMALLIQMANSLLACYTGTALKEMVKHGNTPLESKTALAGMKPRGHPLGLFLSLFFSEHPGGRHSRITLFYNATTLPHAWVCTLRLKIRILILALLLIMRFGLNTVACHQPVSPLPQLYYLWNAKISLAVHLCVCLNHFVT